MKVNGIIDLLETAKDDIGEQMLTVTGSVEEVKFIKAYLIQGIRYIEQAINAVEKGDKANSYCKGNKQTFIIDANGAVRKASISEVIKAAQRNPNSKLL